MNWDDMARKKTNDTGPAGLILVTHGDFGKDLVAAAEMILGPQNGCLAVGIPRDMGPDEALEAIKTAMVQADAGAGVLILTDLFGGTPTTLSLSLMKTHPVEVVAGVNLPMVIKALQARGAPLEQLASEAREAGLSGIVVPGEMLKRRKGEKEAGRARQ